MAYKFTFVNYLQALGVLVDLKKNTKHKMWKTIVLNILKSLTFDQSDNRK